MTNDIHQPQFQADVLADNKEPVLRQLDETLDLFTSKQYEDLAVHIIKGIVQDGKPWDPLARKVGLVVLSRIPFTKLADESRDNISRTYVQTVREINPEIPVHDNTDILLDAGKILAINFAADREKSNEIIDAWDSKDDTISLRIDEMKKATDLVFIEEKLKRKRKPYKGFVFMHYHEKPDTTIEQMEEKIRDNYSENSNEMRIRRKQLVYLNHSRYAKDIAAEYDLIVQSVKRDRSWLKDNGLVGNVHRVRERDEKTQLLRERVLTLYLQDVPLTEISTFLGVHAHDVLVSFRKEGIVPYKRYINGVRYYSMLGYSQQAISESFNIPLHTVELILSVPVNKNALKDLPSEGTIYEA